MSTRSQRRHTIQTTLSECRGPGERRAGLGVSDKVWNAAAAVVVVVVGRCGCGEFNAAVGEMSAAARSREKAISLVR